MAQNSTIAVPDTIIPATAATGRLRKIGLMTLPFSLFFVQFKRALLVVA